MDRSITVIADASYCPNTKVAGYGGWIAGSFGRSPFEGQLAWIDCNNTAEMVAIVNTLWHGFKNRLIFPNCKILIQTDSNAAIRVLRGLNNPSNDNQRKAYDYFNHIIERYKLTFEFRHVAAHTNRADKRSRAQQHCDDRAKRQMIKARALYNLENVVKDRGMRTSYLRIRSKRSKEQDYG